MNFQYDNMSKHGYRSRVAQKMVDQDLAQAIRNYQDYIFRWAQDQGFWDDLGEVPEALKQSEKIALIHSEVSEALEALRHGNPPDDKVPEFDGLTAELADTVIRIFDLAGAYDLDLGPAIVAKMKVNEGREKKHGKEF